MKRRVSSGGPDINSLSDTHEISAVNVLGIVAGVGVLVPDTTVALVLNPSANGASVELVAVRLVGVVSLRVFGALGGDLGASTGSEDESEEGNEHEFHLEFLGFSCDGSSELE